MRTSASLLERLQERLHTLLGETLPGAHLTVAYSGGLDSTALLHLLAELQQVMPFQLSAVHVHHGLSPNADAWAATCVSTCAVLGVPLRILQVNVERNGGKGIEAAARKARHAALASLDCDWIVLAHHRGDQAETLMYRLARGTGVVGASAMRDIDPARRLLRPILDEPRSALSAYATEQALSWIEDESNTDTRFARNALRHDVLEPLNARFPAAEANLARAARHFSEAASLLAELAANDVQQIRPSEAGSRIALRQLSAPRARNVLRYLLSLRNEQPPDEARLLDALKQLVAPAPSTCTVVGDTALCAYRDCFWLESAGSVPEPIVWNGEASLPWGDGTVRFLEARGNDALRISPGATLQLTLRAGGERLRLHAGGPSRALKQLCQETAIPPWLRERLPILRLEEQVLWIGGLGGDSSVRCDAEEQGWLVEWHVSTAA